MTYTVILEGKFYGNHTAPGWNDRIASSARHPMQGGKMERDFVMVCVNAIRLQLKNVQIQTPIAIHYLFCESDKRRDLGNIAYIDKPFCDALQKCGLLSNDGQKDIQKLFFELGHTDKTNPKIIISIEELLGDIENV